MISVPFVSCGFSAYSPNEKWLTDVTEFKYVLNNEVYKLYLSAILDLCDRRIVSFAIGGRNNNQVVSKDKFVAAYATWAKKTGHHSNETKARGLYTNALEAIPTLPSRTPSTKMLVLEAVHALQNAERTLAVILARMQELAKNLKEYAVVRAMPGVGDTLAPRIIAEIGDIRRFHGGSSLVAFAGVDAPPYQSGTINITNRHISKRGSSSLRRTGYEIMQCIKINKPTQDDAVYRFMLKKEAEGKPKKVAKIAAFNKFLRIYFARVSALYSA